MQGPTNPGLFDKIGQIGATVGNSVARQRGFGGGTPQPPPPSKYDKIFKDLQGSVVGDPGIGLEGGDPNTLYNDAQKRVNQNRGMMP